MVDSRSKEENIQDEPEAYYSARNPGGAQGGINGVILKGHRSQLKSSQSYTNMNHSINNVLLDCKPNYDIDRYITFMSSFLYK
jgi:hypothetical protein